MSYTEKKITQAEINAHHVQGATDYLIGNPQQNKAVFDNLPEFIAGKFNDLIDEIAGQHGDEIREAVDEWLAEHPEATTTVQDDSLTTAKYVDGSVTPAKLDRTYATPGDLSVVSADLTNEMNVLDSRMDEFTSLPPGSTSGNAELVDIRVGADGKTYQSAGGAVRGQVADLKSELDDAIVAGGIPHSKAVTKVSSLNVATNGTTYTSNGNYETFYAPIVKNATYIVRVTKQSGTPGCRVAVSSSVPANAVSCTFFVERAIKNAYLDIEYKAQNSGYISVSAWNSNVSVSVTEITSGYIQQKQDEIDELNDALGYNKKPIITKVPELNVATNGTKFDYGDNYETFFIPIYAQQNYTWSVGKSSGSPSARLSFCANVPTRDIACTFIEEKAIGDTPVVFKYSAISDGYLSVSVYKAQSDISLMDVTDNKNGFVQITEKHIDAVNALAYTQIHIGTSPRTIELDSPSIKARNVIDYQGESTPSTWSGGLAIYKNVALIGYNDGYFATFDLLSGNLIATTRGPLTSSHNNNLFFDTKQIVNGYPLVYSSYCAEGTTSCDVYELSISDSSMDVTLVQRISYSGNYFAQDQSVDWCYDEANNNIVAIISKNGATVTIVSFAKPDAFMPQISLTDTDIVSVVTNSDITVRQGSVVIDGYLFMLNGYSDGVLLVIDLATGNTVNRFLLSPMNSHEPEGVAYAHGKIYINMHDGVNRISAHLYELTF